jgi:isopentenyldiphosphate isomerase
MSSLPSRFHAHLRARCNALLQSFRPFMVAGQAVGRVNDAVAAHLQRWPELFTITPRQVALSPRLDTPAARTAALDEVVRMLHEEGTVSGWRDEILGIAPVWGETSLFHIERAALRSFGLPLHAAHLNGIAADGRMWLARRSESKPIDPGCWDTLVGGGIGNGLEVTETLLKECAEEAGMDEALARRARPAGAVRIGRSVPEGWHEEIIFVHDLVLPEGFVPVNRDGEVQEFRLLPLQEVAPLLEGEEVTVEASFILCDYLIRSGFLRPDAPGYLQLHALVHRGE